MRLHPEARALLKQVEVERNIAYGSGDMPERVLDVYRPRGETGSLPTFLIFTEGGFRILSKDTHWMMNALFALRGSLFSASITVWFPSIRFPLHSKMFLPRHRGSRHMVQSMEQM